MEKLVKEIVKRWTTWLVFPFFPIVGLLFAGCVPNTTVSNQNTKVTVLEQRVFELEQDRLKIKDDLNDEMASFRSQVRKDLANIRKAQQFFLDELNQMREDLSQTTNETEKTGFEARKQRIRMDRLTQRVGSQVIALDELRAYFEQDLRLSRLSPGSDKTEFKEAYQLFKMKKFDDALAKFVRFRQRFPSSDLSDDALFSVAYIYFLKGEYDNASVKFFEMIRQYPNSNQQKEAKWWLGISLERSGDVNGAIDIYKELLNLPPKDSVRVKAEFRIQELSAE